MRKNWAYTNNHEDFVRFIGNNLEEEVLKTYLALSDSQKDAAKLSTNTAVQFLKVISGWMQQETINKIRRSDYFTVLLNESTDEGNQSKSSLLWRILNDHNPVENCEMR